jgi:hypothetical protein
MNKLSSQRFARSHHYHRRIKQDHPHHFPEAVNALTCRGECDRPRETAEQRSSLGENLTKSVRSWHTIRVTVGRSKRGV